MPLSLPPSFSSRPIVRKIEQRFGLPGFARLLKLLEQLAESPSPESGVIELPASDWREVLQVGQLELHVFLAYLASDGFLALEPDPESGSCARARRPSEAR